MTPHSTMSPAKLRRRIKSIGRILAEQERRLAETFCEYSGEANDRISELHRNLGTAVAYAEMAAALSDAALIERALCAEVEDTP